MVSFDGLCLVEKPVIFAADATPPKELQKRVAEEVFCWVADHCQLYHGTGLKGTEFIDSLIYDFRS